MLFLLMIGMYLPVLHAQSYEKMWKQVEQAQKKSLPQTVVELTGEIYRKASQEKNVPQMLKAYISREAYREMLTPDSLYTNLKNLESWVQSEFNPVNRAILHSLLAREYAGYMWNNRQLLSGRTALDTDDAPADIREWSINLLVAKVDGHNRASLQDSVRLLETSSEAYVPFVVLKDGSRFYRHDMYHLLAGRAVATYQLLDGFQADSLQRARIAGIYIGMINAYRYRVGAEDAVVLATLDYWKWKTTGGGISRTPYATYHERKERLGKEYLRALDGLIREYGTREVCAEAYIAKAAWLRGSGEAYTDEALRTCDEGMKRYPSYKRIDELRNIREALLQPYLSIDARSSIYPGDSLELHVRSRNLKGFTLDLYRTDLSEASRTDSGINKAFYRKHARKLSATHFDLDSLMQGSGKAGEASSTLQRTDFKLYVPDSPGVYILQVVPDAPARAEEHFIVSTRFKVLTLSLPDNKMEVVTVDGRSGQPVAGAKVSFYSAYDGDVRQELAAVVTDAGGKAVVEWNRTIRSYVARKGTDTAMLPQHVYRNEYAGHGESRPEEHISLLTDRSLYRPGQTVYVKGISYEQVADTAHVLAGKNYRVRLLDVNRKEVVQKEVSTNEFGSFTTDFVLPAVCLNGNFAIDVESKASVSVRVEEYKRPTFEITFNPVKQAFCLGDTVAVTGTVKSYNGTAVQDVPLAYTITRYDYWRGWGQPSVPLVSDTVRLDAQSNFSISTVLKPETGAAAPGGADFLRTAAQDARFSYRIDVSVTGDVGETQTSQYSLQATRQPYLFMSDIARELCKEDTLSGTLTVMNTANEELPVSGICRLYPVVDTKTGKLSDKPVYESTFTSGEVKDFAAWKQLPSGEYGLVLSVRYHNGKEFTNEDSRVKIVLFSRSDPHPAVFMNTFLYAENTEFDAAHPAVFYFGTSHKDAYVLVDVFGQKGRLDSRTLPLNDSILRMEYPYREEYGDGIAVHFAFVKNGQLYDRRVELRKRLPVQTLDMKWEVFRDRLRPGQEEEWKLVVKTPQGFPAAAEVLAMMYDASLDRIYHRYQSLEVYYNRYIPYFYWNLNSNYSKGYNPYFPLKSWRVPSWGFDYFCSPYNGVAEVLQIVDNDAALSEVTVSGYGIARNKAMTGGIRMRGTVPTKSTAPGTAEEAGQAVEIKYVPVQSGEGVADVVFESETIPLDAQALQPVADLRTDFAETAFFYPQLRTGEQGEVAFSFTMPQSLTRWNFRSYSHTKDMMTGKLDATAVTSKEFMLTPNMPRFVRVGDRTQIAASIANLTGKAVKGTAVLTLFEPATEKVIATQRRKFSVDAGKTAAVEFRFDVTGRYDLLGVRIVADGGTFSDGEQHLLPVLSDKAYITETLAMPVRGKETRTFTLDSLFNGNSRTATGRRLTVEFTGNPAWYAVQALPVLSQPATDNAVSWATAFYANTLAGYIAGSQPRIRAVFDAWRLSGGSKETFLSQLEKNQDVKNILLNESPWLLEATTEAEQQQRIATLFDINQAEYRNMSALLKLKELQGGDGSWSWFGGMSGSRHITAYITGLLVRLPLLTGKELPEVAAEMRNRAFGYLNKEALEEYRAIRKAEKSGNKITTLSDAVMEYLYLVALGSEKLSGEYAGAHGYFLTKLGHNLESGTMLRKAQTAVILQAAGHKAQAGEFIASIKEHLVQTDEMGAYFAFHANPYTWGMMPVPVHVAVMDALRRAGGNDALVEEMKLWLLKQKQTTAWNSPVATADAVYALLCQGSDLLANKGDVRIVLGKKVLETLSPAKEAAPGLGYLKEVFVQGSPELKAKSVTVEKRDAGIAWGAVYAQYLSPITDVKQQGGELNIEKKLFVERISAGGQKSLQPLTAATRLSVGDKVVSRLTVRLERAMDFIQLKDQCGACFEPAGQLSGYRWSNGLGYYTEVEDAAANFFFDHLGKGVYVLEHSYRVARGGTYAIGLATVQCAYAPEYASHSTGGSVTIE